MNAICPQISEIKEKAVVDLDFRACLKILDGKWTRDSVKKAIIHLSSSSDPTDKFTACVLARYAGHLLVDLHHQCGKQDNLCDGPFSNALVPYLEPLTREKNVNIRRQALFALSFHRSPQSLEILLNALPSKITEETELDFVWIDKAIYSFLEKAFLLTSPSDYKDDWWPRIDLTPMYEVLHEVSTDYGRDLKILQQARDYIASWAETNREGIAEFKRNPSLESFTKLAKTYKFPAWKYRK